MPFDTLYKVDQNDSLREWTIEVRSAGRTAEYNLITRYGQVGGTITESEPTLIDYGRQGRTVYEQAEFEARSQWLSKMDEGYVLTQAGARNQTIVLPMLAKSFDKGGQRWTQFPAAGQRKFDGVRCLASSPTADAVLMVSRKNKVYDGMNNIRSQIAALNLPSNIVLDGELYSDVLDFQRVTGLTRKKRENYSAQDQEDLELLSMRVYDLINLNDLEMTFANRYRLLMQLLNQVEPEARPNLRFVENLPINNFEDVARLHQQFVDEGYEGLMVRNLDSVYRLAGRSSDLMKVKSFQDEEFRIVGYDEGVGQDAGTPIWRCEISPGGPQFSARPMGTLENRRLMWQNRDSLVGEMLTVKFFEYTNDGIPRFPTGVAIRNYE